MNGGKLSRRAMNALDEIIWNQTDLGYRSSSPGIRQFGIVLKQASFETRVPRFDTTTFSAVFP